MFFSKLAMALLQFARVDEANPILSPCSDSTFYCPLQNRAVHWEAGHTFNPAAVVRNGQVFLIYRAEDNDGNEIGKHTSRLGLALSSDGIHFVRSGSPLFFPQNDAQSSAEFPGGCEDPRIVETEEGTYVMTYTQWNQKVAVLAVATSKDLYHWDKQGAALKEKETRWSKSGSIVCRREGDRLIAARLQGKYWMYWGDGIVHIATSDDLISWTPIYGPSGMPLIVMKPRNWKFDSLLVEAGPPAIITEDGILLLYNGQNSNKKGDPNIPPKAYSSGQVLLDISDPTKILARSEEPFLTPERPYEINGQYQKGAIFIEGLVHFQGRWLLYYGAADSSICVAQSLKSSPR